jgi:hypothetical protein
MSSIENSPTATPSPEPAEISLEELASIYGGSGMVGMTTPKSDKRKSNNGTSGGGSGAGNSDPYAPPVVIPNIPSEPLHTFDGGSFFGDGGGAGY